MNPKDLVGAKKAPLRYVPAALSIGAAEAMEVGALKYGPMNWREQPIELLSYIEAAERHLAAFKDGQDNAEDTGVHHLKHVVAGIGIVLDAIGLGNLIDNRFMAGPAADLLRQLDKSAPPPIENIIVAKPAALLHPPAQLIAEGNVEHDLLTEVPWRGMTLPSSRVSVEHRGEWPVDTRIAGRLACCGQTEHSLDCPQWR